MRRLHGEALYLDLGSGEKPLIVLLTRQIHPTDGLRHNWSRDGGPEPSWMLGLYGQPQPDDLMDAVSELARMRGPRKIIPTDLPDIVTFADTNDPKSVIEIHPNDLQSAFGRDVTWNEITLESTDEPITKGLDARLTWLPAYLDKRLDGNTLVTRGTLANSLGAFDFHGY